MEWKRVFKNKRLLLLSLLLLLATAGIYLYGQYRESAKWGYSLTDKLEYQKAVKQEISEMPPTEAEKWLEQKQKVMEEQEQRNLENGSYDVSLVYQTQVLSEEQEKIEYLSGYPDYLSNILEDSNNLSSISIFKKSNSFAAKNLEKTREDYEGLRDIKVSYGSYEGLTTVMDYDAAHYSILIFTFLLVWSFFEDEKKGLKCIFYATPGGRSRLAWQRIGVLAGGVGAFTLLAYVLLFLCSFSLYGGIGDTGNSIQSVKMFQTCTLPLSVRGYMLYFVFMHMVFSFIMSLFIWMMLLLWRNRFVAAAVLILLIAGETVLCFSLKEQSVIAFFKYANLYQMINPVEMLGTYRNYSVAGMLVNSFTAFSVMTAAVGVVCTVVCISISVRRKTIASAGKLEIVLKHFFKKVSRAYHKIIAGLSLFGMELYKVFIMKKGILFLILWCYLLFSAVDTTKGLSMGGSPLLQEVYAQYSGPDDGQLRYYYLEPNQKLLEEVDRQYGMAQDDYEAGRLTEERMYAVSMRYQSYDSLRNTLNSIQGQLAYMERVKSETGIRVWFLNQKGYKIMMTGDGLYEGAGYGRQESYALYAVILLVFLLTGVFSYDRSCGIEKLLYGTPYGRNRLFHIKIAMAAFLCFLICGVTYGLEFYQIQSLYPMNCWKAPVQSLTFMEKFPLKISIGAFVVWLEVIHVLTLFAVSMMVYLFSVYLQELKGLLAGLLILVLPTVMYLLGIDWCSHISVTQPVIFVESLQERGFVYSAVFLLVELTAGGVCYGLVKRKWCSRTERRRVKE